MKYIAAIFSLALLKTQLLSAEPSIETSASALFYTGDAFRSSTMGNLSLNYRFNRIFWLEADLVLGSAALDRGNGLGFGKTEDFRMLGLGFCWNLPALLSKDIQSDLYTSVGMGNLWIGSKSEIYGFIGGGISIPTTWHGLAVRFDLKNFFYMIKNSQGTDFNSDLALALGPSWLF